MATNSTLQMNYKTGRDEPADDACCVGCCGPSEDNFRKTTCLACKGEGYVTLESW